MRPPRPRCRIWHVYRPDRGRGEPVTGTPGTIEMLPGRRILVFVDPTTFTTTREVEELARQIVATGLSQINLVGPNSETRRVREALHQVWDVLWPLPPKAPREPQVRQERGRCGRPRTDGKPCGQYAGHGADDPQGPCALHGGSTVGREKQLEDAAAAALRWVQLGSKAAQQPLTPAERLEYLESEKHVTVYQNLRKKRPPAALRPKT